MPRLPGASYHRNLIRQIHPSLGQFGGEWVELQMYADGENLVAGKVIRTFNSTDQLNSHTSSPAQIRRTVRTSEQS